MLISRLKGVNVDTQCKQLLLLFISFFFVFRLQVTVGGYKANDASDPEDGCNAITIMCLKASRRLPLNAPCLSLRMHKNMPQEVFKIICS